MHEDQTTGPLQIRVLGGFCVERKGCSIPAAAWQKRGTAQTLVKLLALAPGHRLHRQQVLELLWPDLDPEAADRNLRKALHYARHALEPHLERGPMSRYLLLHDGLISLASDLIIVDADRFQEQADEAMRCPEQWVFEEALSLYTGELLPEDRYEDWAETSRTQLSGRYLDLLHRLAELLADQGSYAAAVARLQQILASDPTREDIHRAIMRLHARDGNLGAAVRQYSACVEMLRRELDVEPDEETETLHQELVTHGAATHPVESSRPPLPRIIRRTPAVPLIGREGALELLAGSLARAERGTGELVLVGGEAGVGKTRLAAEVAREGYRRGALVLWGGSYEAEGLVPHGATVEALEEYLANLPPGERSDVTRRHPALACLLPSLASRVGTGDLTSGGNKTRLFAATARFLRELAARTPVVLILDDLHATDTASLELLHYLARAAPYERWLLAGTYREEEVQRGTPLHRLRSTVTRAGICRRIDLHRLARPETELLVRAILADGTVPPALHGALHAVSAGNPLFLEELIRTMQERNQLELQGGEWRQHSAEWEVPRGVSDLVEQRVHRLGDAVEQTLALAAVAGMEIRFDLLLAASTLDSPALVAALDTALASRILEEREGDYVFYHPLVRAALYGQLSAPRRMILHGTVARALLQSQPDAVEALAYHFGRSEERTRSIPYLELAGDRAAAAHANEAAIDFYSAALQHLATLSGDSAQTRVGTKLGDVLATLGRYVDAEATYAQTLQHAQDALQRIELHRKLGETWEKRGEHARALDAFDRAEEEARATGEIASATRVSLLLSRGGALLGLARFYWADEAAQQALALARHGSDELMLARVRYLQARIAMARGNHPTALALCERALAVSESAGELRGTFACLSGMATSAAKLGDTAAAEAYQRRGIEVAETLGDPYFLAIAWNNLGVSAHTRGDYDLARECYRKCIPIREEIGDKEGLAISWINLGEAALYQGDLSEAEEDCRHSLELYHATQDTYGIAYVLATRASILSARGELCEAERSWQESLEIRRRIGDEPGMIDCTLGLAEIALVRGELAPAYHAARQARRRAAGRAPELEARAALIQARIRIAQTRLRQADMLAAHARHLAQSHNLGRLTVHASLAEAELCLAAQRWGAAHRSAQEALAAARQRGLQLEEGMALHLLGTASFSTYPAEAKVALHSACVTPENMGAQSELSDSIHGLGRDASRVRSSTNRPPTRSRHVSHRHK